MNRRSKSKTRTSPTTGNRNKPKSPVKTPEIRELIISNLTKNVNKDHLDEIFGKYGKMVECGFNDKKPSLQKGQAFIIYEKKEEAEKAILKFNGGQIDGNLLRVVLVTNERKSQLDRARSRSPRRPPRRFEHAPRGRFPYQRRFQPRRSSRSPRRPPGRPWRPQRRSRSRSYSKDRVNKKPRTSRSPKRSSRRKSSYSSSSRSSSRSKSRSKK